jgi:hypothetical protein
MGGTSYRYDSFEANLTRPLYGYLGELRGDGNVPDWVKDPKVSRSELVDLFDLECSFDERLLASQLPDGVEKLRGGRGPTRYRIQAQVYLDAHRDRAKPSARSSWRYVRFDLDMEEKTNGFGATVNNFPEDVRDRLTEIRETTVWDRRFDGYHEQFRSWKLEYQLGECGGIDDVAIVADSRT